MFDTLERRVDGGAFPNHVVNSGVEEFASRATLYM